MPSTPLYWRWKVWFGLLLYVVKWSESCLYLLLLPMHCSWLNGPNWDHVVRLANCLRVYLPIKLPGSQIEREFHNSSTVQSKRRRQPLRGVRPTSMAGLFIWPFSAHVMCVVTCVVGTSISVIWHWLGDLTFRRMIGQCSTKTLKVYWSLCLSPCRMLLRWTNFPDIGRLRWWRRRPYGGGQCLGQLLYLRVCDVHYIEWTADRQLGDGMGKNGMR